MLSVFFSENLLAGAPALVVSAKLLLQFRIAPTTSDVFCLLVAIVLLEAVDQWVATIAGLRGVLSCIWVFRRKRGRVENLISSGSIGSISEAAHWHAGLTGGARRVPRSRGVRVVSGTGTL